ncbi:tyrosine-type recombinase/integrase [Paraburkholderia dinghuensis]|uniref:Site-specific integrase n=1 Tax=Paraburkholderia dinghuensis TaxID=2305225 RepID=A0A3N6M856_9BURK|nr:site-specific integrase [Paraburkholderia dinghuensis]RQG99838.1 site-specific integrase [Paraburkholderia dinghuensis]
MGRITVKQLESLTKEQDGHRLSEDGGIVGRVRVGTRGITVQFRYEFKLGTGKKVDQSLGSWPKTSLAEIRAKRESMRPSVVKGIDPLDAAKAERIEKQKAVAATLAEAERQRDESKTVKDLFEAWLEEGVARKDENRDLRQRLEKHALSVIGNIELRQLTSKQLHTLESEIVARGKVRTAVMVFNDLTQMLGWGEQRQPWRRLLIEGNPIALVNMKTLLPNDYEEERDRVLSPEEIRELAEILGRARTDYATAPTGTRRTLSHPLKRETELALWICLSTLCRVGELLIAERKHVDLENGTWFIPRANVKGTRESRQDLLVFLSDFSRQKFAELLELSSGSEWLFPARNKLKGDSPVCTKSVSKQIGDRQSMFQNRSKPLSKRKNDDSLVLAGGANGNWTPHDLRRTGATMMQELGVPLDVIDRCQNHVVAGPKVRKHYLLYGYAAEKTLAWNKLGERLSGILGEPIRLLV